MAPPRATTMAADNEFEWLVKLISTHLSDIYYDRDRDRLVKLIGVAQRHAAGEWG